jgi:EAL domain-containing protein (putative c-di-GMP-specific phosphodiesterase class I)
VKTIKRIFQLGHSVERSLTGRTVVTAKQHQRWWSEIVGMYGVFWLLSALLMGGAALYAAEHLAALYVAEYMHGAVGLNNEVFPRLDSGEPEESSFQSNSQAHLDGQWPLLLANTYVFLELCVLLFVFAAGVFATLAIYKGFQSIYTRYFSLQANFRRALEKNQLRMHYQPIVDMRTGAWIGAEALLRWTRNGTAISPGEFIPVIEKSWLMPLTTRWICQQVIEDYSRVFWACESFYISINLSAQDVLDPTFADFIAQLLGQYHVPASRIVFEVTEGVMLDKQDATTQLNRLRAQGHKIALDDFGTGYSNLAYLDCLPLDIIKIDRSFVTKGDEVAANTILSHLLEMAWHLNLRVIVEGVELPEQVERLITLGALTAQGWFYSRELSAEELVRGYFSLVHPTMNRVI